MPSGAKESSLVAQTVAVGQGVELYNPPPNTSAQGRNHKWLILEGKPKKPSYIADYKSQHRSSV